MLGDPAGSTGGGALRVIDSSIYLDRVAVEDHVVDSIGSATGSDIGVLPDLEDTDGLLGHLTPLGSTLFCLIFVPVVCRCWGRHIRPSLIFICSRFNFVEKHWRWVRNSYTTKSFFFKLTCRD